MSNQQTTTYLYQFKTLDEASAGFKAYLARLKQYETEMAQTTARMDAVMSRAGGFRGGTQSYSQTSRDGALATREYTRQIKSLNDGLFKSQEQLNRFGEVVGKTNTVTFTGADGIRKMYRSVNTDATPGVAQMRSFNKEVVDGVVRSREFTRHLNDQGNTVQRTKVLYNSTGDELGKIKTSTTEAAGGVRVMTRSVEGMNKIMDQGSATSGRFARHMTWIAQGIVLWAAIGTVSDALRGWYDAQVDMNTALADFEIRTGASASQLEKFKSGVLDASTTTGLPLGEVAAVAPYAPDSSTLKYAAELNRVAGGNLQNQLQWLVAQQRQFNAAGEGTTRILDAVAAGYSLVTLPMEQYVTMLRDAAPLAKEFGLNMEEIYVLFGAMQSVTAAEGRELDYLSRNLTRLYDPAVAGKLGIQTTAVGPDLTVTRKDMITILDELNSKIKDGELSFEHMASVMGASGRRQKQLLQAIVLGWDDVSSAMKNALMEGGNFADMFETKMRTVDSSMDDISAGWGQLMAGFGDLGTIIPVLEAVSYNLDFWALTIRTITALQKEMWRGLADISPIAEKIVETLIPGYTGRPNPFGAVLTPGMPGRNVGYGAQASMGPRGGTDIPGMGEGPSLLSRFPSMYNVPEGVSFDQIQNSMDQWTRAFEALGPQFQTWISENQESALVFDENTKTLRQITGFLPALQRAISENTQQLKAQELNVGLRTVDTNLSEQGGALQQWIRYYTNYLNRLGMPQESRPQLIVGEDDTWLRLWASNEALMLALRQLTKATEDQTDVLSGMWNVPEGATMWVPIQSLFYSRQQNTGGGVGGGTFPPVPTGGLPSQQADWMSLPGAVSQMDVTSMSVMNMDGFTIPVPEKVSPAVGAGVMDMAQQGFDFAGKVGSMANGIIQSFKESIPLYLPTILKDSAGIPTSKVGASGVPGPSVFTEFFLRVWSSTLDT